MEPISNTIIIEFFKKLINLFSDNVFKKVFDTKTDVRKELLSLHTIMSSINKQLEKLITIFNLLEADPEKYREADYILRNALDELRTELDEMSSILKKLSPGLEIYAQEIFEIFNSFEENDAMLIDNIGLMKQYDESNKKYKKRIIEIKKIGNEAKASLAKFIKETYDYKSLHNP